MTNFITVRQYKQAYKQKPGWIIFGKVKRSWWGKKEAEWTASVWHTI
jgi:hypothetical protein